MIPLSRPDYDALVIADKARCDIAQRSAKATAAANQALLSYATSVIGDNRAKALLDLLTEYPRCTLGECLNSIGYVVADTPVDPVEPGRICHVAILDHANSPGFDVVRVFADTDAANEFSGGTSEGLGTYILDAPFEPITRPLPPGLDLDMLAYDIADTMDKGEHGLGNVSQADIRAVLPEFLSAAIAHSEREGRS